MNQYKAEIYACTDRKEVEKIEFDYRTEEDIAAEAARIAEMEAMMNGEGEVPTEEVTEEPVEEVAEE